MRAAAAAALPTPPPPSVGVDLGTSNSAVAVVVDGVPTLVPMRDGRATLPSVVHYPVDGPPLVGRAALARAAADPGRTFFSTKRLMGRSWADVEATAGGLPYPTAPADGGASVALPCDAAPGGLLTPPDVAAAIITELLDAVEAALGRGRPVKAVIGVPAYFDAAARAATLDAAARAGLPTARLVREPVAAALGYGVRASADETILVVDVGGGTTDVSLLEVGGGVVEVLSTGGDAALGGDDWDAALAASLAAAHLAPAGVDARSPSVAGPLRSAAEAAKRALSAAPSVTLTLAPPGPDGTPLRLPATVDRALLDSIGAPLFRRVAKAVDDACFQVGRVGGDGGGGPSFFLFAAGG